MLKNYYWVYESVLDKEFCNYVVNSVKWEKGEAALVKNSTVPTDTRKTNIIWAKNGSPIGCVVQFYMFQANAAAEWNYDLQVMEEIQMSEYKDNGHYDWHEDSFAPVNGMQRKLSCTILLNDPSEFEGGAFEIKGTEPINLKQGSIIVFPSFLTHRVNPVTSGTRYSAVSWANGPSFR